MILSNGAALDFAPQALGETVPSIANGYFYARDGMQLSGKFATYAALYRAQPIVSTLVDKIANAAARLTVKSWDITKPNGKVQDLDSPYAKLIANPSTALSPFNFWRWTFSTYEVYGEAFWYKQRQTRNPDGTQSGPVVNLLPMHPSRTAIIRNAFGMTEYVFTLGVASAGILHASEDDVVPFLRYNPDSLMRGLSRLEPLRTTLLNEDASRRATASFWKRGARPSVYITHPGELSQPAQDRLKANFDARHAGADNMGGTSILEEGMTAQVVQLDLEEMQYIESRKLNLQEGCMVFDVPPPVVHILDHATFSNITEQMRSMYRDTMSPRLEDVESTIDFSLLSDFFPIGERETEFDMAEVLRGDYETRVDKAMAARQAGIYTGNEAREVIGIARSDDPEMDKLYANAALVPLGSNAQPQVATDGTLIPTPMPKASDTPKAVTVRAVMGKIGRVKASKPDLKAKLIEEHLKALTPFFKAQQDSISEIGRFDPADWDDELEAILKPLTSASAQALGSAVANTLDGTFDMDELAEWLESNPAISAKNINQATKNLVTAATDAGESLDDLFESSLSPRAAELAQSRVTIINKTASLLAATQNGAKSKTWVLGPGKARPSHLAMAGETVPLGETFSNGMEGPGDWAGGADEVAGCTCDLSFSTEG